MGAIKKLNSIRTIRNTGRVAGLLFGFLDLYIVFTVDLNIVFTDLFAPLSMLYVPEALVGRVEVVGGIWILLVTWAALLAGRHSQSTELPWRGGRHGGRPHGCPGSRGVGDWF